MTDALPFLTDALPPTGGALRTRDEDFHVEEIPAYLPAGQGDHLYVRFEKRGLNTNDAARAIARALGVDPREVGWAGLKDRHGVTVQTASFLRGDRARALALELPGIRVLGAELHRNKLRTGHLHGNRFRIRLRGVAADALETATLVRERLLTHGVPNYYGEQRFGRDGDNALRGRRWLAGGAPPREPFLRKMYVSAVQSELFNDYLARRVRDGLLDRYIDGDLAMRHPTGGPFPIDPGEAVAEYESRRCSPTGPIFGTKMRFPGGEARAREERVLADAGLALEAFARARDLGEGTRRAVRMCLGALELTREDDGAGGADLVLEFELPAGGYATTVVREFRKVDGEGATGAEQSDAAGESNEAP